MNKNGELYCLGGEKYFYEIKNQVDSQGQDIMNFGYLAIDEDKEEVHLVANGLEMKKMKIQSDENMCSIEIDDKDEKAIQILKSI